MFCADSKIFVLKEIYTSSFYAQLFSKIFLMSTLGFHHAFMCLWMLVIKL